MNIIRLYLRDLLISHLIALSVTMIIIAFTWSIS